MSGSFQFVRSNPCVHRLDLGLYSHQKEFWGNGVRSHVNSKGKIPSTESSEEVQTYNAASRRTASPTHYQLSYSGPHADKWTGMPAEITGSMAMYKTLNVNSLWE